MAFKISFECSQKLTDAQMAFMRRKVEEAVDAMVSQRIDMPEIEDVPEYFYTDLKQAEIEVLAMPVNLTPDEAQQLLRYLDDTIKGL